MKIKDYQLLINGSTRNIFDDEFFEKQDIIFSAVDNVPTRKYIDQLCLFYNKIFIDSGTLGTHANSDIYYPNETICFNDLKMQEKKQIPTRTLKDFPTKIEHCIEFSKTVLNELFEKSINDINLIIEDITQFKNILNEIGNNEELYLSLEIYKYIIQTINNSIIKFAIFIFLYYFHYNINKLLKKEKKSINKLPSPLNIDINNENVKLYFKSFYNIFCSIINFKSNYDSNVVENIINDEKNYIIINDEHLNKEELLDYFEKEILAKMVLKENKIQQKIKLINPIKFEKDDDDNYHINFILSFSNLRGQNYSNEPNNFLTVKEITGNIIPAIASTTAADTGISCLQIYILLQTNNTKSFKNISFNLATSGFDLCTPEEKRFIKSLPKTDRSSAKIVITNEYKVWDKIDLYGPNLKVKDIVEYFNKKFKVKVEYINFKNITLLVFLMMMKRKKKI